MKHFSNFTRKNNLWFPILFISLLVTFGGCGGSDDDSDPGGGGLTDPPEDVEPLYEETSEAIEDAAAIVTLSLADMEISEAMEAAALAMLTHDCVSSAQCVTQEGADPYLIAEFTNGIIFTMPVVRISSDLEQKSTSKAKALPTAPPVEGIIELGMDQPGNRESIFFDLDEFQTDVYFWTEYMADAGYSTPNRISLFDVEDFKNLNNYAVVYVATHGHFIVHEGNAYFGFHTTQLRNTESDLLFIADQDFQDVAVTLDEIVYIIGNEDPYVSEDINYAVTNEFIEKYSGAFPDNSFFYADACNSATPFPTDDLPPLMVSLFNLNVGTVLGWTLEVNNDYAKRAGNYLMGQMLGQFTENLDFIPITNPAIRPYSLEQAFTALHRQNWQFDPDGSELIFFGNGEMFLRPSINQIIVDVDLEQETEQLKLLGNFGSQPGHVILCEDAQNPNSGDALSFSNWEDGEVMVDLDGNGCGYVVVRVDGRLSNPHPLSQWEGDMEVSGTILSGVGPDFELTMQTSWRAEIVEERADVSMLPVEESGWTSTLFGLESSCDFEFSGIFEDANYIYEYPDGANTGNLAASLNGTEMFLGTVTLKPTPGTVFFNIVFAREALVMKTDKHEPNAQPVPDQIQVTVAMMFEAPMSRYGSISSGEQSVPYHLSWPDMEPRFPPNDDTGR